MARMIRRRSLLKGAAALAAFSSLGAQRAWSQSETIKLGFVAPLSGNAQTVGAPLRFGAETAVAQVNAAGGIAGKMVELVIRDDKGDATQTVASLRELVGGGVNLIVGMPLTATAIASVGIIESLGGVCIATGSGEESVTHELFSRHYFTTAPSNYSRNGAAAKIMAEKFPDVTTWTAMIPDITVGHSSWARMAAGLKKYYAEAGKEITILDPIAAKFGSNDFKTQIVSLMSSQANGLHNVLFGADGVTFFKQAREFGLDKKFSVITEQGIDLDLPKALKANMTDNTWTLSHWAPEAFPDNAEAQSLKQAHKDATGDDHPNSLLALSHTAVKAYCAALAKTNGNTDSLQIIEALEGLSLLTALGQGAYRKEDHQFIGGGALFQAVGSASEPGWEFKEMITIDYAPVALPPTPGKKLEL